MLSTPLGFDVDISALGDYISDALGSLAQVWYIPAGLIIGYSILMFAVNLLKKARHLGEYQENPGVLKRWYRGANEGQRLKVKRGRL